MQSTYYLCTRDRIPRVNYFSYVRNSTRAKTSIYYSTSHPSLIYTAFGFSNSTIDRDSFTDDDRSKVRIKMIVYRTEKTSGEVLFFNKTLLFHSWGNDRTYVHLIVGVCTIRYRNDYSLLSYI